MEQIKLEPQEMKSLNKAKREIITDAEATYTSQSRNNKIIGDLAEKYNVSTEVIFSTATWKRI